MAQARPGKQLRKATRKIVKRAKRLQYRRQFILGGVPYGFTGLPVTYFNSNLDWKLGGRLHWTDYSQSPFRYTLSLQWSRPPDGKTGYFLRLRVPRLGETPFGLTLQGGFIYSYGRYYGRGNDSPFRKNLTDPDSPSYKDKYYYQYILERPQVGLRLLGRVRESLWLAIGFEVRDAQMRRRGATALLFEEVPQVNRFAATSFMALSLIYDTRDDELLPQQGTLHEWFYETARDPFSGAFGGVLDFDRYSFTDLRYIPLSPRLLLANRVVFEILHGSEKPIDAYGELGSSRNRIKGLGGDASLRGYDTQRFVDDVRFMSNTELRYHLRELTLFRQHLEWRGLAFFDLGRVWPDLQSLSMTDMHLTGGGGLRLLWNADFVIRMEMGFSAEQTTLELVLRNSF
jgi:outer membrane protein assembly factor BamA